MRKICVITGTRAEYGLLKPIMKAIDENPSLELSIIATGMHLSEEFGYSLNEIVKDGFKVTEKVEMNPEEDTSFSMSFSVGKGIQGMAEALKKINPDILLILGDRTEALAGAIAAAYMNIAVAHIHGGDVTMAGLDESIRHAITKIAHIHFPVTKKSEERLLKLGEDKWRVFISGAPCLDTILHEKLLSEEELKEKLSIDSKKQFLLLVQHAVTTEPEKAEQQIIETLNAINELKYQTVIIYPNSDAGGRKIISQIKKYEDIPFIKTYKNLPQKEYLSLLKHASVMIGNSSSGIIESSSFKLPVVNLGIRQNGRERSDNVIDADFDKKEIIEAIKKALYDKEFISKVRNCENPYGEGKAAQRITKVLSEIKIDKELLQKKIAY